MSGQPAPGPRFTSFTMILPTYNEEARIARVLEYFRPFARIVVVDNFSSDRTFEIAQEHGVEAVRYRNQGTTQDPQWIRFASTLLRTDYVLFLACSEFLPVPLLEKLDEVARTRSADVVSCFRTSYTCGETLPQVWGPAPRVERFANLTAVDLDAVAIHGSFPGVRPERILTLAAEDRFRMTHLRDADAYSLITKHAAYARVEATHRLARGERLGARWLLSVLWPELISLVKVLLAGRSRVALREIWARIVMHTVTCWIGWELATGKGAAYSQAMSSELWAELVRRGGALGPGGGAGRPGAG